MRKGVIMATPQRQFKDGLFDVTHTVNSWLQGFHARLRQVARELGETEDVKDTRVHYAEVLRLTNAPAGSVSVKGVYFATSKMNQMLVALESEMRWRRDEENINEFWEGRHSVTCPERIGGTCDCDLS